MYMSIISKVLGQLKLVQMFWLGIASLDPKFNRLKASVASMKLSPGRPWHSIPSADEFNRRQLSKRDVVEFQSRLPIAR